MGSLLSDRREISHASSPESTKHRWVQSTAPSLVMGSAPLLLERSMGRPASVWSLKIFTDLRSAEFSLTCRETTHIHMKSWSDWQKKDDWQVNERDLNVFEFIDLSHEVVVSLGLGVRIAADSTQKGWRQLVTSSSFLLFWCRFLLPHQNAVWTRRTSCFIMRYTWSKHNAGTQETFTSTWHISLMCLTLNPNDAQHL